MGNDEKNKVLEERIEALEKKEKLLADLFNKSSIDIGFMEARSQEIQEKLKEVEEKADSIDAVEERVDIVEGQIQVDKYGM